MAIHPLGPQQVGAPDGQQADRAAAEDGHRVAAFDPAQFSAAM
jgi:hypothetical protein